MDLDEDNYNDVTLKLLQFVITCRGIVRLDDPQEPVGVEADGTIVSETEGATMETSGGTCRNTETDEERIFPAGIYRLSKKHGIEKIGEIVDE